MNLTSIKDRLTESSIFHAETFILNQDSVIGYEKKFKWSWMATQLNTFIVATDFEDEEITPALIEKHLKEAFEYSKEHYTGWPRGLQSGVGVISVLISNRISPQAQEYCEKLKSGKKWAAFTIPVVHNPDTQETFVFKKNPMWGRIYYPHFKRMIQDLT